MDSTSYSVTSKELCLFLSRYAVFLLGCGATCIRLEKNVRRMAHAFGKDVELTIMPRHVHMTVYGKDKNEMFTSIDTVLHTAISFDINTRLSELSWEVADRKIGFFEAKERFESIISSRSGNRWVVLLLVSLANASFCRLFGGDWVAMLMVGIATLAGFYLKQQLLRRGFDARVTVFFCAFLSSVLGATCALHGWGTTPDIAIGTSVLYLVPGIPFLNSFSDMIYSHYICAFSRFVDALILTGCLSVGLCCGMLLMNIGMF